jgi:hypothetical protein
MCSADIERIEVMRNVGFLALAAFAASTGLAADAIASMAGSWALSIAAKVQGEPETVVGKITYSVE